MSELLSIEDLPTGFSYPRDFIRVVELGLTNLEPWWIVGGEVLRQRHLGIRERYPSRSLVPFAVRQDCDDIACWDIGQPGRVAVIHDYAGEGDEQVADYDDFQAWFRAAVEDLLEWE
jgi:hypothetical protein